MRGYKLPYVHIRRVPVLRQEHLQVPRKQWQAAIKPNLNLGPARRAVHSHCSRTMQVSRAAQKEG